jgi:hypothetical protein
MGVHDAFYKRRSHKFAGDSVGTPFVNGPDWANMTPVHDRIRINHYWTKSYEEWLSKRNRGRADEANTTRPVAAYWEFGRWFGNNNTLIDKYVNVVKMKMRQRTKCGEEKQVVHDRGTIGMLGAQRQRD